jgi:hypothetical protein
MYEQEKLLIEIMKEMAVNRGRNSPAYMARIYLTVFTVPTKRNVSTAS